MVFKAKKDWFYRLIFYLTFIAFFYIIYESYQSNEWLGIVISLMFIFFLGWIWFGTTYVIQDDLLQIRTGPIKKYIEINNISNIRRTKNPFASAALAMERIEINYEPYETIQISPLNVEKFIAILQEIHPDIRIID